MHPRLAELVEYVEAQRAALLDAVALVPEPLRQHPARAGVWSVAEILEHLHLVEHGIGRLLAYGLRRIKAEGVGAEQETGSMLASLDAFHLTRRQDPIDAPAPVRPTGEYSAGQALAALEGTRQALLSAINAVDGMAIGEISYPHPLLGSLNLYQWVLFVGEHEARHAAQIEELAQSLGNSHHTTDTDA